MPPAFSWFLALRYLVTRWVSVIGLLGVALAVWAMIVVIAVFSGFIGDTRRGIREASPDLLLVELPADADFVELQEVIGTDPDVAAVAPRVTHDAILDPQARFKIPRHTDPIGSSLSASNNYVLVMGVDPEAEERTTGFTDWLRELNDTRTSAWIQRPSDYAVEDVSKPFEVSPERIRLASRGRQGNGLLGPEDGIVLGMFRIRNGDLIRPGEKVDVATGRFTTENGEPEFKTVRISLYLSGAYRTKHRFLDLSMCLMDIETLRQHMGHADPLDEHEWVTEVAIKVRAGADPKTVGLRLEKALADRGGGKALTWEEQNATYLNAVNRERTMMKIVLFAVLVVAGFLIFATLHMMVVQKTKDIGILSSLGATPTGIGAVFIFGGLAVGVFGCSLGLVTGYSTAYFLNEICEFFGIHLFPPELYALDEVPVNLETPWMLQVAAGALALSLLVAWLPARRAARQDPVKALMHE